jgi:hypothetical protein
LSAASRANTGVGEQQNTRLHRAARSIPIARIGDKAEPDQLPRFGTLGCMRNFNPARFRACWSMRN